LDQTRIGPKGVIDQRIGPNRLATPLNLKATTTRLLAEAKAPTRTTSLRSERSCFGPGTNKVQFRKKGVLKWHLATLAGLSVTKLAAVFFNQFSKSLFIFFGNLFETVSQQRLCCVFYAIFDCINSRRDFL
jgi:hypothetical protein